MKKLIGCIASSHITVSDGAMCFFENDFFLSILKTHKNTVYPMFVPIVLKKAEDHWHPMIKDSLTALSNILRDMDVQLYDSVAAKNKVSPKL